jgi:hypothetical protein
VQRSLLPLVGRAALVAVASLELFPQATLEVLLLLLHLQAHGLELRLVALFLFLVALPQLLFPLLRGGPERLHLRLVALLQRLTLPPELLLQGRHALLGGDSLHVGAALLLELAAQLCQLVDVLGT